MHAVILIGGYGTRLRPLTDTVPKSMLTVGNEPIITRLVRRLERAGITVATLSLGYLPDPYLAAFPGDRCGSVELRYAVDPEPLDTAGAIRFGAEAAGIDGPFVVVNGDVIGDLDVAELVRAHEATGAETTIHLTPVADPSAYGVVEVDTDGRVQRFVEKPPPGVTASNLVSAGTYVMQPAVLELIEPGRVSVERETFPRLAAAGALFGHATDDYWLDAGSPAALLQANLDRLAGRYDVGVDHPVRGGRGVSPDAVVAAGAEVVDSVVAPGVIVGRGSVVRRSVLLGGAEIGQDVVVDASVVMGRVGDGAALTGAVIGAAATIEAGRQVNDERVPAPAG